MIFTEYNFFKINLTEPASPLMYGIIELHDHIFFFLNMILFLVLFLLVTTLKYFTYSKNSKLNKYILTETVQSRFEWLRLNHGVTVEILWTVVPSIVLLFIAVPSFALLYATDELIDPSLTVQVIAHQWYWSYEYNDLVVLDRTTATLTYLDEKASKVESFLHKVALVTNHGIVGDIKRRQDFIWLIAHPWSPTLISYFGLSKHLWYAYGTNRTDTLGLKETYKAAYNIYKIYIDPTPNKTMTLIDWSEIFGFWWKQNYIVGNIEFDSYLKQETDLAFGEPRLYETDFPLVLPKFTHIRFMITSEDVLHSWSVPALGIKVDAVPGRINHAHTYIKRSGTFYGQCSELCGVNHGFMPIQIVAFEPHMYYNYIRLTLLNK